MRPPAGAIASLFLWAGCTAETLPLAIKVDFPADVLPTMVLTLIEANKSASYIIDLRDGAGIDQLPRLTVNASNFCLVPSQM